MEAPSWAGPPSRTRRRRGAPGPDPAVILSLRNQEKTRQMLGITITRIDTLKQWLRYYNLGCLCECAKKCYTYNYNYFLNKRFKCSICYWNIWFKSCLSWKNTDVNFNKAQFNWLLKRTWITPVIHYFTNEELNNVFTISFIIKRAIVKKLLWKLKININERTLNTVIVVFTFISYPKTNGLLNNNLVVIINLSSQKSSNLKCQCQCTISISFQRTPPMQMRVTNSLCKSL